MNDEAYNNLLEDVFTTDDIDLPDAWNTQRTVPKEKANEFIMDSLNFYDEAVFDDSLAEYREKQDYEVLNDNASAVAFDKLCKKYNIQDSTILNETNTKLNQVYEMWKTYQDLKETDPEKAEKLMQTIQQHPSLADIVEDSLQSFSKPMEEQEDYVILFELFQGVLDAYRRDRRFTNVGDGTQLAQMVEDGMEKFRHDFFGDGPVEFSLFDSFETIQQREQYLDNKEKEDQPPADRTKLHFYNVTGLDELLKKFAKN
jgi:hypothetical protein